MKKLSLLLTAFLLLNFAVKSQAQTWSYKDYVGDNPNAEADIEMVQEYFNAIAEGDLNKVSSLLADEFKGYGPSPADSTTKEQIISTWKENYKTQLNRKISVLPFTFRLLQGGNDMKGDWVPVWGNYSCTINDKNISVTFQNSLMVVDGKIVRSLVYYDNWNILKTLGYTLTPPEKKK